MNNVGFRQIASLGALALALGLSAGSAQACSIDAWTTSSGSPLAGGPLEGALGSATRNVPRYMGLCGLQAAAGGNSYVAVDHGQAETTYRARFYFYASSTAPATVMQSYSDVGASTAVITVTYDPSGSISATVPGSTIAPITGIVANRWYGVEVTRIVGQPAVLAVRGGGGGGVGGSPSQARQSIPLVNATSTGTGNATGNGVRVTRLGAVGPTTGTIAVDEFEASRGSSAIGFRLRADANTSGGVDAGDISAVAREAVSPGSFLGAADCNESGGVDAGDIGCTARIAVGL
ncbi:hypothetical protein [Pseudomarimonas salicorniae]|uniref:Uncharacterized protein n=1 Tax=Pseudomarimonas salicorniae TaxID=2933270 RepID=A0ABT0GH14_9GAMM|nr:hypothetical protein [Lysobacter sp. CAU 1642]MCK7593826.1 hypothetical protein [Lysobacter sp. CAU 1642]